MSATSNQMNVLLTVRSRAVADRAIAALGDLDVQFLAATTVDEVDAVLGRTDLDHVIMGGGLDLESRLLMVRLVFEASSSTTVHMGARSGPETYLPFVRAVLDGLLTRRAAPRRTSALEINGGDSGPWRGGVAASSGAVSTRPQPTHQSRQ